MSNLKDVGLVILSSVLLVVSFPSWDKAYFAWVALVPLFVALAGRGPLGGFLLSYVFGMLFLPGIFHWILQISYYRWYHHVLLAVYFGAYLGLFGLGFSFILKRMGKSAALGAAPFLWVALEYVRGNFFFLALPWGLIGHTQYRHTALIQMAALFGTYSISFLIVLVNAALTSAVFIGLPYLKRQIDRAHGAAFTKTDLALMSSATLGIAGALLYGSIVAGNPATGKAISVAVVQGNIEQAKKWDPRYADEILQVYADLTLQASTDQPDLIIWPETAAPGSISLDPDIHDRLNGLVEKTAIPLVLGSARHQKFQDSGCKSLRPLNSAFLLLPGVEKIELQQYDKIKLFPFGEYLPQKNIIPWQWIHVSSLSEYVPGTQYTVFRVASHRFGVTICWENIFPNFVRQFVKRGAQFIVNITNEARFGKTAAPYQLAAISVFRAVENRIFMIRCANTGVSCIIDPCGRIIPQLKNAQGQDLFVRGILNGTIIPTESKTFYTRNGDLAPILAIAVSLIFIFIAWSKPLAKRKIAHDAEGQ